MAGKSEMPSIERGAHALEAAHGIQDRAAAVLGIPRSTLQKWLSQGPLAESWDYVRELRAQYAPRGRGRPWVLDDSRERSVVEEAWKASGFRLALAARMLDVPRTSLRHLLHRYGLPNLPASGRATHKRTRE
jgi:DNA-binding protein Fis